MTEERIDIVVSERGSRVVSRNIDGIGVSAEKTKSAVDLMKDALKAIGAAVIIRETLRMADAYTTMQNRLRAAGLEGRNLNAVYTELLRTANTTRQSVDATVETYARLANSTKSLGLSQQDLLGFTDSLNKAVALSGATAQEAGAGIRHLAQGMASGRLQGDELRAVLESLPTVADVIAKGMGATRGELRRLASEGKITTEVIIDAFAKARGELTDKFGKSVPTLSQAFVVLRNSATDFVGKLNETIGFTSTLASIVLLLANNLDTLAKMFIVVTASTLAFLATTSQVGLMTAAYNLLMSTLVKLYVLVTANPIGILIAGLTAAVTAITLFRDEINLGIDDVTTLGDLFRAVGYYVAQAWSSVSEPIGRAIDEISKYVGDFNIDFDLSLAGALRAIAVMADAVIGLWRGVKAVVVEYFRSLAAEAAEWAKRGVNALAEAFGSGKIFDEGKLTSAAEFGQRLGTAFMSGFTSSTAAQDAVGALLDRAQKEGQDRLKSAAKPEIDDTRGTANNAAALAEVRKELDQLLSSYNSVYAAKLKVAEATDVLTRAEQLGAITSKQKTDTLTLINAQLRDQLDPVSALNRELTTENELLKMNAREREIAIQMRSIEDDLRGQGIALTQDETAAIKGRLEALQRETEVAETRAQVLAATSGIQEEYKRQLENINQLVVDGALSQEQANTYLIQQNYDLLEGTREGNQLLVDEYQRTYDRINQLRQDDVISEQTATQLKLKLKLQEQQATLGYAKTFFSNVAELSKSQNKKLAAIGKAAAIANATIKTYESATSAYAALVGVPYVGPYLAAGAAAAAVAAGLANVQAIRSQELPGYAFGGQFTVGGVGKTDSQTVAFRATPGEKVAVTTPTQEREKNRREEQKQKPDDGFTLINLLDPSLLDSYLSTARGRRVLVNALEYESATVQAIFRG